MYVPSAKQIATPRPLVALAREELTPDQEVLIGRVGNNNNIDYYLFC